jgi:tRNA(Ile)-lysidine synthase
MRLPNRRDPAVARILRDWRRLTSAPASRRAGPGAPTLVACSGGADSAALVLALATSGRPIVVAHIVHDLRDPALALADRDAVKALAAALDLEFAEASVHIRAQRGNAEALARRERYRALAHLARERRVVYIATAHHADDQLESVLMALVRGAGPAGLAGVAPSRPLGRADRRLTVIRPMLGVTRADAEAICAAAGYQPRIDHTNADTTRLRAALRARVTPVLRELRPSAPLRAACAAALLADAAAAVRVQARRTLNRATERGPAGTTLARRDLARLSPGVLGEALRLAAARVAPGAGADRRGSRALDALARAVRDDDGSTRRFTFGGVCAVLTGDSLTLSPAHRPSVPTPELPRAHRPAPRPRLDHQDRPDHPCPDLD